MRSGTLKRSTKKKRRSPRPSGSFCQERSTCRRRVHGRYLELNYCAVHLADRLVGDRVKLRDRVCVRCGGLGPLDWAHVRSRTYGAIRWSYGERLEDPWNNSVALCRPCHYWQGLHPLEGEDFFASLGIDLANLRYLALNDPPQDPEEIVSAPEFVELWTPA